MNHFSLDLWPFIVGWLGWLCIRTVRDALANWITLEYYKIDTAAEGE